MKAIQLHLVLSMLIPKMVPAPTAFCSGVCEIPFSESCNDVVANYKFYGSCCSLADNTATGGCTLTITQVTGDGYCDYIAKNWTCGPCVNDTCSCVDGDNYVTSSGTAPCPSSNYDVFLPVMPTIVTEVMTTTSATNETFAPVYVTSTHPIYSAGASTGQNNKPSSHTQTTQGNKGKNTKNTSQAVNNRGNKRGNKGHLRS